MRTTIRTYRAELAVGATLLAIYLATLAPSVTLWDSGEFLSAIHSLGIPHPPGTPLYILLANVWAKIWAPLVGFAYSVNMLSAVCTAVSFAFLANLFVRWTGDRLAAFAGALVMHVEDRSSSQSGSRAYTPLTRRTRGLRRPLAPRSSLKQVRYTEGRQFADARQRSESILIPSGARRPAACFSPDCLRPTNPDGA